MNTGPRVAGSRTRQRQTTTSEETRRCRRTGTVARSLGWKWPLWQSYSTEATRTIMGSKLRSHFCGHPERSRSSGGAKDLAWGIYAAREIPCPAGETAGFWDDALKGSYFTHPIQTFC